MNYQVKIIDDLKTKNTYSQKEIDLITSALEIINKERLDQEDKIIKKLHQAPKDEGLSLLTIFLILLALSQKGFFHLDEALKILIAHESQAGGPYYSDLVNKKIDRDTNIVIYYYLLQNKVSLPNLKKILSQVNKGPLILFLANAFNDKKPTKTTEKDLELLMINKIVKALKIRLEELPSDFRKLALRRITKTINNNPDRQMSLISYYFKKSLQPAHKIREEFVVQAGVANIFFWTAFIIYDDFWDEDEAADPRLLPIANLLARHYITFYNSLFKKDPFFNKLMDNLDAANTWELISCRAPVKNSVLSIPKKLPNYKRYEMKYRAASGHILGPVMMLKKVSLDLNASTTNSLIKYFKNYLIAMQLNDDSHDWKEDLARGALSTVTVMIIKAWLKEFPEQKTIDLKKDLKKLEAVFWFKTIKKAAKSTIYHCQEAQKALDDLTIIKNKEALQKFIDLPRNIARKALIEQKNSLKILKNFK